MGDKRTDFPCRASGLGSQHLLGVSQISMTLVLGDPIAYPDFCGCYTDKVRTHTHLYKVTKIKIKS